jgi:hypothetical protein
MKYVSIGIETTGLDPAKHSIIEFAAVIDDLSKATPIQDLASFRALVLPGDLDELIVSPYCARMHAAFMDRNDQLEGVESPAYEHGPEAGCGQVALVGCLQRLRACQPLLSVACGQ